MSRQDQYLVTVTVDGAPLGVFDTLTGGEVTSDITRWRSGGMGASRALGGMAEIGDVTVSRLYDRARDHEAVRRLYSRVGKARASASKQPLDPDGNVFGKPITYQGVLQAVTPGDADSNSADADTFELVITPEGDAPS